MLPSGSGFHGLKTLYHVKECRSCRCLSTDNAKALLGKKIPETCC